MAYIDIDIEDYLDEVSTKVLLRELKNRKAEEADEAERNTRPGLVRDLRAAWDTRDETLFEWLLDRLENPAVCAAKIEQIKAAYSSAPKIGSGIQ